MVKTGQTSKAATKASAREYADHDAAVVSPAKSKGKQQASYDAADSYWVDFLKKSAQDVDVSSAQQDLEHLLETLNEQLSTVSSQALDEQLRSIDAANDADQGIVPAIEQKRVKRLERKVAAQQEQLDDERDRLKTFKRSRDAQEKEERAEAAKKLHPQAKAFLSGDLSQMFRLPSGLFAALESRRREIQDERDGEEGYDPTQDPFLQNLSKRLEPLLSRARKRQNG